MNNFILQEYLEDVSICDKLIELHKLSNNKAPGFIMKQGLQVVDILQKASTDTGVCPNDIFRNATTKNYFDQLQNIVGLYIKKYPMCNNYAPWQIVETSNIQHYKPNEGFFVWHTEKASSIAPNSNRHLVFMTYLNDVNDQGETEFYHQELKVQPKKGLTLIWPADWTHTHRGITSPTEEKYIITGWYNFI
jgi:hypothetical protein